MNKLFKEKSQCIKIFLSLETIEDPFEKNVSEISLNPIPIQAIVTDFNSTQMSWKSNGIIKTGGKEIIVKKSKKSLLELSQKIEIDGIEYQGWKTNGKMEYRQIGNYITAYIYRKQV